MKRGDFLQKWGLSSLKLNLGFMEGKFPPSDYDKAAVWNQGMGELSSGIRDLERAIVLCTLTPAVNVVRDKASGRTIETKN